MAEKDLSLLFTSRASFKTLAVLTAHSSPLALRHIAYLAKIPVFSVQRVLQEFLKQSVVITEWDGRFKLFQLNHKHARFDLLNNIFGMIRDCDRVKQGRSASGKKVEDAMRFSSDIVALMKERHGRQ